MNRSLLKLTLALIAATLWLGSSANADAQIPEVSTDGSLANPAAGPPSPGQTQPAAPEPVIIPIGPDGQVGQPRRLPGAGR